MWKTLYIEKKTGGRPRKLYIHYIADVLHRLKSPRAIKFRILWANEKHSENQSNQKLIEQETRETIPVLKIRKGRSNLSV